MDNINDINSIESDLLNYETRLIESLNTDYELYNLKNTEDYNSIIIKTKYNVINRIRLEYNYIDNLELDCLERIKNVKYYLYYNNIILIDYSYNNILINNYINGDEIIIDNINNTISFNLYKFKDNLSINKNSELKFRFTNLYRNSSNNNFSINIFVYGNNYENISKSVILYNTIFYSKLIYYRKRLVINIENTNTIMIFINNENISEILLEYNNIIIKPDMNKILLNNIEFYYIITNIKNPFNLICEFLNIVNNTTFNFNYYIIHSKSFDL